MAAVLTLGEDLLQDAIQAAARDLVTLVIPGSNLVMVLAEHFCMAAWNWLCGKKPSQRQQAIDALTQTSVERARVIAETALANVELSPDNKATLVNYLSAIPMTARRAISRPDDGGTPTTLLSQLPRSYTDLRRFVPLRPPRFRPGERVPGHDYRLELLLGQDGFAEVWKARHLLRETQPPVALKFCLDPALLVSFKMEIKALDRLSDPSYSEDFVRLLHTAYNADPPFLEYEYIDGGDLVAWLASFDGQPPAVRDVVRVLKMAARAVAFAHQHGIVHRDLKPANLLVTRKGRVKVADFGIGAIVAKAEAQHEWSTSLTGATLLQGAYTPLYAPRLSPDKTNDPWVDVYALGVIAYQLLTGDVTRPMGPAWRTDLELGRVPSGLLGVLEACVTRRLADAGALLAALNGLGFGESEQKRRKMPAPAAAMVNYCIQCGRKVQPADRFCVRCGYRLR